MRSNPPTIPSSFVIARLMRSTSSFLASLSSSLGARSGVSSDRFSLRHRYSVCLHRFVECLAFPRSTDRLVLVRNELLRTSAMVPLTRPLVEPVDPQVKRCMSVTLLLPHLTTFCNLTLYSQCCACLTLSDVTSAQTNTWCTQSKRMIFFPELPWHRPGIDGASRLLEVRGRAPIPSRGRSQQFHRDCYDLT